MSPHSNIQFGIYLPQLQMSFDTIRDRVQLAERLGFHSAWFMDHLYAPGMPQVPATSCDTGSQRSRSATQLNPRTKTTP